MGNPSIVNIDGRDLTLYPESKTIFFPYITGRQYQVYYHEAGGKRQRYQGSSAEGEGNGSGKEPRLQIIQLKYESLFGDMNTGWKQPVFFYAQL